MIEITENNAGITIRVCAQPWMPEHVKAQVETLGRLDYTVKIPKVEKKTLRSRKKPLPSKWAESHRNITMSSVPGPWRNELTPYLAGIMDSGAHPAVQVVILCKAPQVGGSEVVHNFVGYCIDHEPGPVLYVYPDELTGKENMQDRIQPMINSSPRLRSYKTRRVEDMTTTRINFRHMPVYLAWAGSPMRLGNKPIRHVILDEINKYPPLAGKKETDSVSLAEKRTNWYKWTRTIWKISTPTDEKGRISVALNKEAQVVFYWWVRCPDCGRDQLMEFGGKGDPKPGRGRIRWPEDERDPERIENKKLAWYGCGHCRSKWDDAKRDMAVRAGHWRAQGPDDKKVGLGLKTYLDTNKPSKIGFHIPAWLSYFVSLSECAAAFLKAQGSFEKLKDFMNNYKAEPWRLRVVSSENVKILDARCALKPETVPSTAVALTAGIDRQLYSYWFVVRAWANDYTSWLIHYGQLATWEDVEALLFETAYPVADSGRTMGIARAGIDTGGGKGQEEGGVSLTEDTYWWLRQNHRGRGCRVWGTKGSSRPLASKMTLGKVLDRMPSGKPFPAGIGIQLVHLDTERLKDAFHYRLGNAIEPGPQAAHLHSKTGKDYTRQILAEVKERDEDKGVEKWVNPHNRDNHLFDCEVICHATADPEFPGGGIHLIRPYVSPVPPLAKPQRPEESKPGYQRPGWLNR